MAGFQLDSDDFGSDIPEEHLQLDESQTILKGYMLKKVYGKLNAAGTTDKCTHLALENKTSSATNLKLIRALNLKNGRLIRLGISLTGIACAASSTTTTIKIAQGALAGDGNANDIRGGYILNVKTGERRLIKSNSYAASVNSIVVSEPFAAAPTTGDLFKILPLGPSDVAVQLNGANNLALTIAGRSSGQFSVHRVGDKLDFIVVTANP